MAPQNQTQHHPHALKQCPRILVLGGGVIGLHSALYIQQRLPRCQVTVMADRFDEETTSWGAGALFRPIQSLVGPTPEITRRWYTDSLVHYRELAHSSMAAEAGVMELPGYYVNKDIRNDQTAYLSSYYSTCRPMTAEELKLCEGPWVSGTFTITWSAYMPQYLKWLAEQFRKRGGKIVKSPPLQSFLDIDGTDVDLVVNCTGLGSAVLCDDPLMIPVRGHLLKMSAPWIRAAFFDDDDHYVIPTPGCVTVGGLRQFGKTSLEIKSEEGEQILKEATEFLPALKGAKLQCHWVGLRPYRGTVRIEKAWITTGTGKRLPVVHNYGHGSTGMSVGPGVSKYCALLVEEHLSGNHDNVEPVLSKSKL